MAQRKLLLYLLLFLVSLLSVSAAADFNAGAAHQTLGLCACGTYQNNVLVSNAASEVVTINVDKVEAPQWVTTVPPSLTLSMGQSSQFTQYLDVSCDAEGEYPLYTTLSSHNGIQKQIKQTMQVKKCPNTVVAFENEKLSTCPCQPKEIEFLIENVGVFEEDYVLNASPYSDHVSFSQEEFTIGPGVKKKITMTVALPCEISGSQTLNLVVYAKKNDVLSQVPFDLGVDACYDFDVDLPQSIHACSDVENTIPLEIVNNGKIDNLYSVSFDVPWATLDNNTVEVDKESKSIVGVKLNPPEGIEQKFTLTTTIEAAYGEPLKVTETPVTLNACYDLTFDVRDLRVCEGEDNQIELSFQNTGVVEKTVTLETWGFEWLTAQLKKKTLAPGEETSVLLNAQPPLGMAGTHDITFAIATTDDESFQQTASLIVVPENGCRLVGVYTDANLIVPYGKRQIPFVVENRGLRTETYTLSLDAGSWVSLEKKSLTLAPDEKEVLFFEVFPTLEQVPKGDYGVTVYATPTDGGATYAKTFVLGVGKNPYLWWIIIGAVAFVFTVLFLIVLSNRNKKKKRFVTVALQRDHKEHKKHSKNRSWVLPGVIVVALLIVSGFIYALVNHYDLNMNLFYYYAAYVVITMLVFLGLIVYRDKKAQEDEESLAPPVVLKKETKKSKPKKEDTEVEQADAKQEKKTKKPQLKKVENVKDVVANFKKMEAMQKKKRAVKKKAKKAKKPTKK